MDPSQIPTASPHFIDQCKHNNLHTKLLSIIVPVFTVYSILKLVMEHSSIPSPSNDLRLNMRFDACLQKSCECHSQGIRPPSSQMADTTCYLPLLPNDSQQWA